MDTLEVHDMDSTDNVLGADDVGSLSDDMSDDTLNVENSDNVVRGSMCNVSLVEGHTRHATQSCSRAMPRFSSSSSSLLALSLLALLPGTLAEGNSTNSQNASVVTATTTTVGAMMNTSSTASGDISVTKAPLQDLLETLLTVLYYVLAGSFMTFLAIFLHYFVRVRRTARNNQGGALGGNNPDAQPNGNVVVGRRDPDDHPGEIMELREARHIPGEIIPMVAMGGGDQEEEEGEEEDAV